MPLAGGGVGGVGDDLAVVVDAGGGLDLVAGSGRDEVVEVLRRAAAFDELPADDPPWSLIAAGAKAGPRSVILPLLHKNPSRAPVLVTAVPVTWPLSLIAVARGSAVALVATVPPSVGSTVGMPLVHTMPAVDARHADERKLRVRILVRCPVCPYRWQRQR